MLQQPNPCDFEARARRPTWVNEQPLEEFLCHIMLVKLEEGSKEGKKKGSLAPVMGQRQPSQM